MNSAEEVAVTKEEIPEDLWEIVENRILQMPPHLKMSVGGSPEPLDRDQLLEHLHNKDDIGITVVKMELNYLQSLSKLSAGSIS